MIRIVFFGVSSLDRKNNIAISIIVSSILIGLNGTVQPFKIKHKNYQELVLFLNLQILYIISLYDQGAINTIAINVIIAVAAVHFTFIITYYIITYACGEVIRSKIQVSINTLKIMITRLYSKSQHQQFQLGSIRDNIPEVAFSYHDYCEPLVGLDD